MMTHNKHCVLLQVEHALSKIAEVRQIMIILLVLEGCGLFLMATVYACLLVRKVSFLGPAINR